MRITISIILLFLIPNYLFAQLSLKGRVHDETGAPVSYASVTMQENGTSVITAYSLTNDQGKFELKINNNLSLDNYTIRISSMGYEKKTIDITDIKEDFNIILKKQNIKIDEVKIKAPKINIKGDTISYSVNQFASENDHSIGDILEKIPGIEVSEDGAIKYQGNPINKFYIEGMDLLEDKYGIATTNIAHEDVSRVEVYENHQPIKALNGIVFSENAAINLKINEASKSVWIGNAILGIGASPVLWDESLTFMRFGEKSQSINILKSNNTRIGIIKELNSLKLETYIRDRFQPTTKYFNMPSNSIDINKERSSFNESHSFSTSELWKLGKNLELKTQVLYGYNDLTFTDDELIDYYTQDDTISITEKENFNNLTKLLGTNLTLTLNTEQLYFKNKTTGKLEWNNAASEILGTNPTDQKLDLPQSFIKNNFEILRRKNNHVLGLSINTNYINFNHSLILSNDSINNKQMVSLSEFYNGIESSYNLSFGIFDFSLKGGTGIYSRNLNTFMNGSLTESNSFNNDSSNFKYIELYGSPELESSFKGLKIKIRAPYSFYYYNLNAQNIDKSLYETKNLVSPNLSITYYITPKLYLRLLGGLNKLPLSYKNLFYGNILTDNINIKSGYTDFLYDDGKHSSLSLNYKNPLSMFYFSSNFSLSNYESSTSTERTFVEDYILNTYKQAQSRNNLYMVNTRISKGIDPFNMLQTLKASYAKNNSVIIQEDIKYNYLMQNINISYDVSMQFVKVVDLDYGLSYSLNNQIVEELSINSNYSSTKHDISVYITPVSSFSFFINSEYYSNLLYNGTKKELYLFDLGCKYNKNKRWLLEFKLQNIFNNQYYTFNQSNALANSTIRYYLRPRQALVKFTFNI